MHKETGYVATPSDSSAPVRRGQLPEVAAPPDPTKQSQIIPPLSGKVAFPGSQGDEINNLQLRGSYSSTGAQHLYGLESGRQLFECLLDDM